MIVPTKISFLILRENNEGGKREGQTPNPKRNQKPTNPKKTKQLARKITTAALISLAYGAGDTTCMGPGDVLGLHVSLLVAQKYLACVV